MKNEEAKTNNGEEKDNLLEQNTNDIKSRLRKNPNKTKPLYTDDYNDKKTKKKKGSGFPPNDKDVCRDILEQLKQDEKSVLFRQPAIKSFANKEDREYYKKIITEPRDLGNITKKLKTKNYSIKEVYEDLELCWSNAIKYNEEDTEAYKCALYMRELAHKIFEERNLMDIVNKPKENSTNNNTSNDKTPNKELLNNENGNNVNDNKVNVNNANDSHINDNKNDLTSRKRKRNDNSEDVNKKKEKNKKIKNSSSNTVTTFKDIKNKFIINSPILTSPDQIGKSLESYNSKKNILLNKKGNSINVEHSNHHTSINHFTHKKSKKLSSENLLNVEGEIKEKFRKIKFMWIKNKKESVYTKKNEKFIIQKSDQDKNKEKDVKTSNLNNNTTDKNSNISVSNCVSTSSSSQINNNTNLNWENKVIRSNEENACMNEWDINYNSEHTYDMKSIMVEIQKLLEETQKQQPQKNKGSSNNNKKNNNQLKQLVNNQGNNTNNNNKEHPSKENKRCNEKEQEEKDKVLKLRHSIAKNLDKLTDNNMIDFLVFLENIRPQAIKELPNDTIYVDMEQFSNETYSKTLDYIKNFV